MTYDDNCTRFRYYVPTLSVPGITNASARRWDPIETMSLVLKDRANKCDCLALPDGLEQCLTVKSFRSLLDKKKAESGSSASARPAPPA